MARISHYQILTLILGFQGGSLLMLICSWVFLPCRSKRSSRRFGGICSHDLQVRSAHIPKRSATFHNLSTYKCFAKASERNYIIGTCDFIVYRFLTNAKLFLQKCRLQYLETENSYSFEKLQNFTTIHSSVDCRPMKVQNNA